MRIRDLVYKCLGHNRQPMVIFFPKIQPIFNWSLWEVWGELVVSFLQYLKNKIPYFNFIEVQTWMHSIKKYIKICYKMSAYNFLAGSQNHLVINDLYENELVKFIYPKQPHVRTKSNEGWRYMREMWVNLMRCRFMEATLTYIRCAENHLPLPPCVINPSSSKMSKLSERVWVVSDFNISRGIRKTVRLYWSEWDKS